MGFVPVADGVLVTTSRRESTTTVLALGRRGGSGGVAALLVDPAWAADELVAIADEAAARGVRVAAGFATHAHHDHLLWHPRLGTHVPRWATATTAATAGRERSRLLAEVRADGRRFGGPECPPQVLDLVGRVTAMRSSRLPDPDDLLPAAEVVEHDGHAPGHGALWLPVARVLVAGDMLSDVELPLPCDEITGTADVGAYLAGLDRLAPFVGRADVLVPGHGTPTDRPTARLDADRRYLDAVLAGRAVDDPRLARPGMAAEHARLERALAGGRADR
ncbi:MBL fold metallo-hydrolase [Isoptericola hypogeus]|uniref:MBL fold metallo-hydrolase n=1 Tax=Isoptericola hypogeus TaxID=300179 RepID=A0ABN2JRE0_9MICO